MYSGPARDAFVEKRTIRTSIKIGPDIEFEVEKSENYAAVVAGRPKPTDESAIYLILRQFFIETRRKNLDIAW